VTGPGTVRSFPSSVLSVFEGLKIDGQLATFVESFVLKGAAIPSTVRAACQAFHVFAVSWQCLFRIDTSRSS
jgi:hypothetical protein